MDEGCIKFNCQWEKAGPVSHEHIREINAWRDKLYALGLIGQYPDGIGFGNISIRAGKREFIITGTATGGLKKLSENHYVLVTDYDLKQNKAICRGPLRASSESLTHAAIYECSPETRSVIHVHSPEMWKKLMHELPTTREEVAYGTPEMALEIKRLFRETRVEEEKMVIMGGHPEGIIAFGKSPDEAGKILLNRIKNNHH